MILNDLFCRDIAAKEGVVLLQSYKRTLKQLMIDQLFRDHPKRRKKANAAARRIKTIAGRMVRDLERKMTATQRQNYDHELQLFHQVLNQQRKDTNKLFYHLK